MNLRTQVITIIEQDLRDMVEKQILNLINTVHVAARDKVSIDTTELESIEDYNKNAFNMMFDEIKPKEILFAKGQAIVILETIKSFDLKINPMSYNLLRYLVLNF